MFTICRLAPNSLLSPSHRKWKELSHCHHLVTSFSAVYFDASFEDQKLSDDIKLPPHKFSRPQCCYFWWQKILKLLCLGVIQRHNMRNKFCENRLNVQSLGVCADLQTRTHIHTNNRDLKSLFFHFRKVSSQFELKRWVAENALAYPCIGCNIVAMLIVICMGTLSLT